MAEVEETEQDWSEVLKFLTPKQPLFCPETPSLTQKAFLRTNSLEAFFGGMGGGGKSSALLMAALQFVDVPGYSAILFRRTFADLSLPGALMDRFINWMKEYPDVRWNDSKKQATFPSGAVITFGYLDNDQDYQRYRGAEFQFVGMDEVTEIRERDYRFLFSRLRKPPTGPLSQVPLRMRSASNPSPNWVRQHFIVEGPKLGIPFIPSSMLDNPGVDVQSYLQALSKLDLVEQKRMRDGDWWVTTLGSMFKRQKFVPIAREAIPMAQSAKRLCRFWDLAGTEATEDNRHPTTGASMNPDWTVGVLAMWQDGMFYILDVQRARLDPAGVQKLVADTALSDGKDVAIRMQQDPAQAGKDQISNYSKFVVPGYDFKGMNKKGDKETAARPFSAAVANNNVRMVISDWNSDFLDELTGFPESCDHDDQLDAVVGAFAHLTGLGFKQRRPFEIIL